MDKVRKELEVLKSWGIESISVDKVLNIIEETEDDSKASSKKQNIEIPIAVTTTTLVGGTIFYIDNTVDGKYEFFDIDGNLIENVQVGDRPYSYRVVKKGFRDKYYVYHDKVYSNLEWTYIRDNYYVYEHLGTYENIGSGKTNTEIVMAKDNGAYITANSNGRPTIWHRLQQIRNAKVGGCNDWFVPSRDEILMLKEAIKSGRITGGKIAGSSYKESVFSKKEIWSSSESFSQDAWIWHCYGQIWYFINKCNIYSVFFVRAF